MTIEQLREAGANVDEGFGRCAGNEAFYLKIVKMVLDSDTYDKLNDAIAAHDLEQGFEYAHALKGIVANASLDKLLKPVSEMTELLRARQDVDYSGYLEEMFRERDLLKALE